MRCCSFDRALAVGLARIGHRTARVGLDPAGLPTAAGARTEGPPRDRRQPPRWCRGIVHPPKMSWDSSAKGSMKQVKCEAPSIRVQFRRAAGLHGVCGTGTTWLSSRSRVPETNTVGEFR